MTAISSTQPPQVDPHLPTFLRQALLADEEQLRRDYSNNAGRSTTSDKIAIDDETYPRDIIHTDVRSPHALLVPPLNFQNVTHGISRSGHPNERNYEFIRRLRLKSIMCVLLAEKRKCFRLLTMECNTGTSQMKTTVHLFLNSQNKKEFKFFIIVFLLIKNHSVRWKRRLLLVLFLNCWIRGIILSLCIVIKARCVCVCMCRSGEGTQMQRLTEKSTSHDAK